MFSGPSFASPISAFNNNSYLHRYNFVGLFFLTKNKK